METLTLMLDAGLLSAQDLWAHLQTNWALMKFLGAGALWWVLVHVS